jgi:hypothetical protein
MDDAHLISFFLTLLLAIIVLFFSLIECCINNKWIMNYVKQLSQIMNHTSFMRTCLLALIILPVSCLIVVAGIVLPPLVIKGSIFSYKVITEYAESHSIPDGVNATDGDYVAAGIVSFIFSIIIILILLACLWCYFCGRIVRTWMPDSDVIKTIEGVTQEIRQARQEIQKATRELHDEEKGGLKEPLL